MSSLLMRIGAWDEQLLLALVTRRRPLLDLVMRSATHLADAPVAILLTLPLATGLVPDLHPTGIRIAWTLGISHLSVQLLKRLVTRKRPDFPAGLRWPVPAPDRFSFPSGHATAAMAIALPLALSLSGVLALAVLATGLLVGLSRCYLGVHYPGDVLAGWALAVGTLTGVVLLGL